MPWSIYCMDKPDTDAVRAEYQAVYRKYLDQWEAKIFFCGPLQPDDGSKYIGSLFILDVDSREVARAFADSEPYKHARHVHQRQYLSYAHIIRS
jgi:uncharacterized protein